MSLEQLIIYVPIGIFVVGILAIIINRISQRKSSEIADIKKVVIELVKEINSTKTTYDFGHYGKSEYGHGGRATRHEFTIFETGDLDKYPAYPPYHDAQVLFRKKSNQILGIDKFINDPILPRSIKGPLSTFHSTHFEKKDFKEIEKTIIYVGLTSGIFKETQFQKLRNDTDLKLGNAIAFQSFRSFQDSARKLEREIEKWATDNKISLSTRFEKY